MATAEATEERVVLPPTVNINSMRDKFAAAMNKGSVEAAKASAAPPAPEPPKAAEKPAAPAPEAKATPPKPEAKVPPVPKGEFQPKEAPKEPEKAATPPAATNDKTPRIAGENFRRLEADRDQWKTKATEFESKLKELEARAAQPQAPADYEESKKKLAEYQLLVDQIHIEKSPKFKAAFDDKIAGVKAELAESVGSELSPKLQSIMQAPPGDWRDSQVEELAKDMSEFRRASLVTAYRDLKRLEKDRAAELSRASETLPKLRETETQAMREQQAKFEQALQTAHAEALRDEFSDVADFKAIVGNDEHNADVQQAIEMSKSFLTPDLSPQERARMAFYATMGYRSFKTNAMKDALIAQLQKQVKELQGANPGLDGGRGGAPDGGNAKPVGFVERMQQAMTRGIPKKD